MLQLRDGIVRASSIMGGPNGSIIVSIDLHISTASTSLTSFRPD